MFERVFLALIGLTLTIVSAIVIFAWKTNNYELITLYSRSYPIQFNAGILIGLMGMGLILQSQNFKKWVWAIAFIIFSYSFLVILQYAFKISLGIDNLFDTPFFVEIHNITGRIAPNNAVTFMIVALSLVLLTIVKKNRWFPIILASLGFSIFSFASITLIGQFGNLEAAYGWSLTIRMSIISAISFCIFGASVALYSRVISQKMEDPSFNRWFAIPYSLFNFLITIFFWQALLVDQEKRRIEIENAESSYIASQLQTTIEYRYQSLKRMANRWIVRGGTPYNEFKSDADLYIAQLKGLDMIAVVESGKIIWEFHDSDKPLLSQKDLTEAITTDKMLIEEPDYIWIKFYLNDKTFLLALLHSKDLIQEVLQDNQRHFLISVRSHDHNLYMSYGFPNDSFKSQAAAKFHNIKWMIDSYSTDYAHGKNHLTLLSFIAGTILSLLVGFAAFSSHSLKQRSHELEEAQKALIEQEKLASLGALTAGIAHEIKNPLNFINNFSDIAHEHISEFKTTKDAHLLELIEKNMEAIHQQSNKANGIITRMLAHSHMNSNDKVSTDINQLIEEDLNLALHSFRMRNPFFPIKVVKELSKSVPLITLPKEDLSRVILNLLNNSFYALEKKKGKDSILTVKTGSNDENIYITIHDNGIGIPESIKDKLYTPFFTTKPPGIGTGLGLSISRAFIVEELGGKIECKSKEGEFSEFTLLIPFRTERSHLHQTYDEA